MRIYKIIIFSLDNKDMSEIRKITKKILGKKLTKSGKKILGKYVKTTKEFKINQKLNHACIYTNYGIKMYLDPNDTIVSKSLNLNLIWEKEETEFLRNVVKEGMNVVDIGANIGYFSLLFSKWVGDKGKVYSFEPDPFNFDLLLKNSHANRSENISCFQKAISNHNDHASLFLSKKNKGDHRIFDFYVYEDDDNRKSIDVECVKLDSILPSDEKIDFIKMDIQGSEYLALEGMNNSITKNPNIQLLTEFWPYAIEKSGHSPKDFIEQLRQFGFHVFVFDNNTLINLQQNDPIIQDYDKFSFVNLICRK